MRGNEAVDVASLLMAAPWAFLGVIFAIVAFFEGNTGTGLVMVVMALVAPPAVFFAFRRTFGRTK